jgi:hypothetical protein
MANLSSIELISITPAIAAEVWINRIWDKSTIFGCARDWEVFKNKALVIRIVPSSFWQLLKLHRCNRRIAGVLEKTPKTWKNARLDWGTLT